MSKISFETSGGAAPTPDLSWLELIQLDESACPSQSMAKNRFKPKDPCRLK
jgi:hypothetical protein